MGVMMATSQHTWSRSTFGGNLVCEKCKLFPLDEDDMASPCEAEPEEMESSVDDDFFGTEGDSSWSSADRYGEGEEGEDEADDGQPSWGDELEESYWKNEVLAESLESSDSVDLDPLPPVETGWLLKEFRRDATDV